MNVFRIVPFLDFGGVEQRVKLTAFGFQDGDGVHLSIVALGHGGKISEELIEKGIKPLILGYSVRIPNLKLIYRLYCIFKEQQPDVVHCSGSEANFHGLLAAKMAGVKIKIGEEIGFPKHHVWWRITFRAIYSFADHVIAISHVVADKIVELGEVPRKKVRVIYNPVQTLPMLGGVNLPKEARKFVFITVCRLVPVKNIKMLLRSFQQLAIQVGPGKVVLHIVGEGPEGAELMRACEELNLNDSVRFLGFQKDVSFFLRNSDAFVLPSFSEGFSIAMVEAMQCGLPSIVTKVGGPAEIIEEPKTGFLIDPHSEKKLTEAMWKVYSMAEADRKLMGYRARAKGGTFSPKYYVDRLMKLYLQ